MDKILQLITSKDGLKIKRNSFLKLKKQINELLEEIKNYINKNKKEVTSNVILNNKIINITERIVSAVDETKERALDNCGVLLKSVILEDYEKNNIYINSIDFDKEKNICVEIYSLLKDTFDIEKDKQSVEKNALILTTYSCLEKLNKTVNCYINAINTELEFLENLNTQTK